MKKNQLKTLSKKLSLHRETILALDVHQLTRAAGMGDTTMPCKQATFCECPTTGSFCC